MQPMRLEPDSLLAKTIAGITAIDATSLAAAGERQSQLTKPAGALGLLEAIGNQLSAIYGQVPPPLPGKGVLAVFAGDHGVYGRDITPWPQTVTVQMLVNMCHGGAAVNALAAETGTVVWPIDIGVANEVPDAPGLRRHRVRNGTADFTTGMAMSRAEAQTALELGIRLANEAVDQGADVLLTGEVGLGNTTVAAALIAALTGTDASEVTGCGAGAGNEMLARKIAAVRAGLATNHPDPHDPVGVLAAVGGLEHGGMAGFILGGAARGVPVILDGVISASAALIAVGLAPEATGYLIAGHHGREPGIQVALARLGLPALVDLRLRLGEGTGALVALSTVRCAARVLRDMATFAEAGVAGRNDH